ncbi:MAG: hypothetical protein DRO36_01225 [Candidatus Hecatellales archaeon]|nr:MAG: hypothetical protein DRO36_01225 [Candidatus Hecatellales archaeon]
MAIETFYPLLGQLGFGGILGFVIGYTSKKLLKILMVFIGLFFMALLYLSYTGFIQINYDKISATTEAFLRNLFGGGLSLPLFLSSNIPFIGSFIVGFGLGFKTG